MDIEKIKKFILDGFLPSYRIAQIEQAIYKNYVTDFLEITQIPLLLREKLNEKFRILSFLPLGVLKSDAGNSYKAVLKLEDGVKIESALLLKNSNTWTVCISTQAGCPVGCKFCLSGKNGLKRNLNFEEISDQFLFWASFLKKNNLGKIASVVYMGMGEPFLNYNNLIESIKIINTKYKLGKRNISVSTVGHPEFIRRFAKEMPQVNLAISLHSVIKEIRDMLIPFNSRYSLDEISKAVKDYIDITKRKVFLEYVMLKDINDRIRDAGQLVDWINKTHKKKYFTVNLIPYNPIGNIFKPSEPQKIKIFQNFLITAGVNTTIRKSLGLDIKGACGQLSLGR